MKHRRPTLILQDVEKHLKTSEIDVLKRYPFEDRVIASAPNRDFMEDITAIQDALSIVKRAWYAAR
jgi:hypothetical protein